jgi:branched-chain amino acid aminotransferase
MKVWLNGEILEDPMVPITSHAIHYGASIFEGIRSYELDDGSIGIFRLEDHIDRFYYSAKCLHMDLKYPKEEIIKACEKVVLENNLKDSYIRPVAYYNFGRIGLNVMNQNVDVAIFAIEFPKYLPDDIKVMISSYRRLNPAQTHIHAKIGGHYVNSILATIEAKKFGYDEALLLDMDGFVAEGPGENIFFIKDNTLYTPPDISILPGITRNCVIEFAKDLGYDVVIKPISVHELPHFEEAFFTGTAAEITPISKIEDISYSTKKSKEFQKYYSDIVRGRIEKYTHWIHIIEYNNQ